jgi:hypothetical protein
VLYEQQLAHALAASQRAVVRDDEDINRAIEASLQVRR